MGIVVVGMDALADDLGRAAEQIVPEVKKVTGQACNNMKKGAQRRVRGYAHLPHLARSFTYDVTAQGTTVVGQVGAEHERLQGKLDVFIEFGTLTSAPIPHWAPALQDELPAYLHFLEAAAADLIEKG